MDEALNGRLEPDEQVRDRIGYEVLVDAEDLVFVFSSDWISGKTFVALGDEPAFIELPQQVVGENVIGSAFSMGEKINAGTLSIVVNDVSLYQQYGRTGYGDPDPGFQYLVADLTFTNEGQQEISLDPDDDLWVKDNLCRKYMSDWTAEIWLDTQDFQDTLTPGEMSRGQIAYQVAADAESFVLVFTPDSSETSKLFVNLQ